MKRGMTEEQLRLIREEDDVRRKFAENRNSNELNDPHLMLENVFSNNHDWDYQEETDEEKNIPHLLTGHQSTKLAGKSIVHSVQEFERNWQQFSQNMFHGLDWTNVFIAGGSILACLTNKQGTDNYGKSDIDIFVYGFDDEDDANRKLKHISEVISRNTGGQTAVIRTKRTVTFINSHPFRHVQVILKLYRTPAEVLLGFDVDVCTFGYDGTNVYAMERGRRALTKRYNLANETRRSTTYEGRLYKYSKRGFAVLVPGYEQTRVNPAIFNMRVWQSSGLAKLVLFNHHQQNGTEGDFLEESDYSPDLEIPWGPGWTAQAIVNKLNAKDKSQFYASKFRSLHDGQPDDSASHKHLFVPGLDDLIKGDFWCEECKAQQQLPDESDEDFVPRRIVWVTESPAYQDMDQGYRRKLMTGSFKLPLEENWTEIAYNGPPATYIPARPSRGEKRAVGRAEKPAKKEKKMPRMKPKRGGVTFGASPASLASNPMAGLAVLAHPPIASPVRTEVRCEVCNAEFLHNNQLRQHQRNLGHTPKEPTTPTKRPATGFATPPATPTRLGFGAFAASPANYGTTAVAPGSPAHSYLVPIADGFADNLSAFGVQPGGSNFDSGSGGLGLGQAHIDDSLVPPYATTTTTSISPAYTGTGGTTSSSVAVVASDRQYGEMNAASRALYLISLAYKQGDISESERQRLKEQFIKGSEIISAAVEVFDIDRDMNELVDTFKRLSFSI